MPALPGRRRADDPPSERLIEQRVRNNVIDCLRLAASFEAQRHYLRNVPGANAASEIINLWEDNFPQEPAPDADLLNVYTADEVEAIRQFHAVWEATADAVPRSCRTLSEVQALPQWDQLRRAAAVAHEVFARRGRMPQDREVP